MNILSNVTNLNKFIDEFSPSLQFDKDTDPASYIGEESNILISLIFRTK
jgi:hypothetical protein